MFFPTGREGVLQYDLHTPSRHSHSCRFLESRMATLRDVIKMERTIVVRLVMWRILSVAHIYEVMLLDGDLVPHRVGCVHWSLTGHLGLTLSHSQIFIY